MRLGAPADARLLRADHFDQLVQEKLRKDLPIVTTKHAEEHLAEASLGFTKVVSRTPRDRILARPVLTSLISTEWTFGNQPS